MRQKKGMIVQTALALLVVLVSVSYAQQEPIELVSITLTGEPPITHSGLRYPTSSSSAISANGRYVAFSSSASNLVAGDTNWIDGLWFTADNTVFSYERGIDDIFVRDRVAGTTKRISVAPGGVQANDDSSSPSLSGDGRYVAYLSSASNLVPGDTNGELDVFIHDWVEGTTARVSVATGGVQANDWSFSHSLSGDGRYVAFT